MEESATQPFLRNNNCCKRNKKNKREPQNEWNRPVFFFCLVGFYLPSHLVPTYMFTPVFAAFNCEVMGPFVEVVINAEAAGTAMRDVKIT